jgi:hypothetical protein
MAYAGEQYGSGGAYSNGPTDNPVRGMNGLTTEHAAAAVVIGCLVFLIAIRRGFSGVSVSSVTGGLVKP